MKLTLGVGQVRRATVPFTENPSDAKFRPVVVLGWSKRGAGQDEVILVVPITSFGGGAVARDGDVPLDYLSCGLTKPSWARARRIWGADPKAFKEEAELGKISQTELSLIYLEIEALISPTP